MYINNIKIYSQITTGYQFFQITNQLIIETAK